MTHQRLDKRGCFHDRIQVDSRFDPQTFEHVDHILCGDVAGRAGCVGASTESTGGRVERRDAEVERRQDVRQRHAPSVVKMQRNLLDGQPFSDRPDHTRNLPRMRNPDREGFRLRAASPRTVVFVNKPL